MVLFSLCIPTMNRFDNFLKSYLEEYLKNDLIDEIIITDEIGDDIDKINNYFSNNINFKKLKLYKNEKRLGPFLNKHKACKIALNEWIALIDSDNFADKTYFEISNKYIIENNIENNIKKNIILAPSKAKPNFNYSHLSNKIINKNNLLEIINYENNINNNYTKINTLMNTGNYIINKFLIDNLDIDKENINFINCFSADVIYFNTLLFEQLDLQMHIVKDLEYKHVVHNGSIYINTHSNPLNIFYGKEIHNRFYKLYK
jgi:hypothetical protein